MSDWIRRKPTNLVTVGNVKVGDFNPISVQSMTNTLTTDIKATIIQINNLAKEGADLVRVSVPDKESTLALKEIVKHFRKQMYPGTYDIEALGGASIGFKFPHLFQIDFTYRGMRNRNIPKIQRSI